MDEFCHLHLHTHSSDFDGLGTEQEFAEKVAEMGQPAMAVSDHGSLRGLYAAQKACDKVGIKLVPGVEAYLADDAELRGVPKEEKAAIVKRLGKEEGGKVNKAEEARRRDRDHITIWAMNDIGLRNLYRLMAWAWTKGFYYKSRVDMKRLKEFNEGLLVSTGCPTGIISSPLRAGKTTEAIDRMETLAQTFGDRLYCEIMPHTVDGNTRVNGQLLRLAEEFGAKPIVTQDAHYPNAKDADSQECLLAIQTRASMHDPDRFCFSTKNFWARSRAEMMAAFQKDFPDLSTKVLNRGMDETVLLADRCTAKVFMAKPGTYLAAPKIPAEFEDYDHWLASLCARGAKRLFPGGFGEMYRLRLFHELDTIAARGASSYFVSVWDAMQWAREQGIMCGARGSGAGCLVSYMLGISRLDPVKHDLSFTRFMNPGRTDLPDLDIDIMASRRQEFLDYLRKMYGDDHVAQISSFGKFGAKSLVHDIARIWGLPRDRAEVVAKSIGIGEEEAEEQEGVRRRANWLARSPRPTLAVVFYLNTVAR